MRVALIGATGNAGSRILTELTARGHEVSAICRHPEDLPEHPNIVACKGDAQDTDAIAALVQGHDAVISSVHFAICDGPTMLSAVRASGVKRYLVVGGAGGLEAKPGVRIIDLPNFPPQYFVESSTGIAFHDLLRSAADLDWTFLSPSAEFVEGERTGQFRLGRDAALFDSAGRSWISYEDYAVALVDELETPAHIGMRFTVGY